MVKTKTNSTMNVKNTNTGICVAKAEGLLAEGPGARWWLRVLFLKGTHWQGSAGWEPKFPAWSQSQGLPLLWRGWEKNYANCCSWWTLRSALSPRTCWLWACNCSWWCNSGLRAMANSTWAGDLRGRGDRVPTFSSSRTPPPWFAHQNSWRHEAMWCRERKLVTLATRSWIYFRWN